MKNLFNKVLVLGILASMAGSTLPLGAMALIEHTQMTPAEAEKALLQAVEHGGTLATVKNCLKTPGINVNATTVNAKTGFFCTPPSTPLKMAAWRGRKEVVEALIQAGADLELLGGWNGNTALMDAIEASSEEIVDVLVQAGAKVDTQRYNKDTALLQAARYNQLNMVKILVLAGADANKVSGYGGTALTYAIEGYYYKDYGKCNKKMVQFLLRKSNVDPFARILPSTYSSDEGRPNALGYVLRGEKYDIAQIVYDHMQNAPGVVDQVNKYLDSDSSVLVAQYARERADEPEEICYRAWIAQSAGLCNDRQDLARFYFNFCVLNPKDDEKTADE